MALYKMSVLISKLFVALQKWWTHHKDIVTLNRNFFVVVCVHCGLLDVVLQRSFRPQHPKSALFFLLPL